MKCGICGVRELATGDLNNECSSCSDRNHILVGWKCPHCSKCHAPWVVSCDCHVTVVTSNESNEWFRR